MSTVASTSGTPTTAGPLASRWATLVGVLIGVFVLSAFLQLEQRWTSYVVGAAFLATVLPLLTLVRGGLYRLAVVLFLFSIQLELSFLLMHEDRAMPGGVQGVMISLQFLLAAMIFVTWAWRHRRILPTAAAWGVDPRFLRAALLFIGACALSIWNTTERTYTAWGVWYLLTLLVTALAASHICSTREGLGTFWKVIYALLIVQSAILIIQYATGISFSLKGDVFASRWGSRVGGTLGEAPVSVATFLMTLLFFAEQRLFSSSGRQLRTWVAAFALGFLCLLLSQTRSCWVGFTLGSIFLVGSAARRGRISSKRVGALVVAALIALAGAWGPVRARLDDNHEHAAEERWRLNYVDLEMIKAHPIVGIGMNTVYESRSNYMPSFFTDDDWLYIAHNQFLHVTAEAGIVGLAAFVWLLWTGIRAAASARRSQDSQIYETATALAVSQVAMLWGMNLDFYSGMQVYLVLWFVLGCASGIAVLARREAAAA